jgi:prolipoprotein diacylglyceryltransferase
LAAALIVVERKLCPARGRLLAWYVAGYTAIRFFVEGLRIDEAKEFAGFRFNQWVSIVVFAIAVAFLVVDARRSPKASEASTVLEHE